MHLGEGGAALITTHGAYAAPPVRARELLLDTQIPDPHDLNRGDAVESA